MNPNAQAGAAVKVDVAAFGSKFQSKSEIYRFLTHDCGSYLPKYESISIYHMADLAAGRRKRIKERDVKVITIPHFEGLKIERMLEYAANLPEVMQALPITLREREKLPRGYLANLIYTLVGDDFKAWVNRLVDQRHDQRRQQEDMIHLDPEIAAIFNQSQSVAVNKGISNNLMKAGAKRRRTKGEIMQQKLEEQLKERQIQENISQFNDMQSQIQQLQQSQQIPAGYQDMQEKLEQYQGLEAVIDNLKERGYIKFADNRQVHVSQNIDEQMEFRQIKFAEDEAALQLSQQNQQLEKNRIDEERLRASQQLEPNESFQQQLLSQIDSNSGALRNSVVLLDHPDVQNMEMQQEQIQPRFQNDVALVRVENASENDF